MTSEDKGIVEGCFWTWVAVTEKYREKLSGGKEKLFNDYGGSGKDE